jgi:hypothetical protein
MAKETRSNKDFSIRTHEVGRWAREHIKRQTGVYNSLPIFHSEQFTQTAFPVLDAVY